MLEVLPFREVWAVDFEYQSEPGEIPVPVCLVALELKSRKLIRLWRDDLHALSHPPYPVDADSLFVAYTASAEIRCHLALGWPVPARVLDLFVEFRALTNGLPVVAGNGLIGALAQFGLDAIDADVKEEMRQLILSGGPWTAEQVTAILDYCQSDVDSLDRLLPLMLPRIDLPRALLRGRYMAAVAGMEHNGVPLDLGTLTRLRRNWDAIQHRLIDEIDADYGVYENGTFRRVLFEDWLKRNQVPWPHKENRLDLSDDAFREMARSRPEVAPLHELRATLSQMRLAQLEVGADGRNRTMLSVFRARTGRNQPSNSRFIFGPAVWVRSLIQPPPGHAVAYLDWSQQEFGIAAALSGDHDMQEAYRSGDPYLAFAKQAGAVPAEATKASHGAVRDQFKACVLAVQYGMGEEALASRIGQPTVYARRLLRLHRQTYSTFWEWSDRVVDYAVLKGRIVTTFGWPLHIGKDINGRSLRNFPMQANGAEMLRLACILGIEMGIEVCAPVHDAVLITAPLDRLDEHVALMAEAMAEASRIVLDGFELRSDCAVVRHPNRYSDPRGERMWERVMALLDDIDAHQTEA